MPHSINPDNILKGEEKAGSISSVLVKSSRNMTRLSFPEYQSCLGLDQELRGARLLKEEGSVRDMSPQCRALVGTLRTVVCLDPENSSARWCYPGFSDRQRRAVISPVAGLALTHQTLKFTPSHWAGHPAWWCESNSWALWLEKTKVPRSGSKTDRFSCGGCCVVKTIGNHVT